MFLRSTGHVGLAYQDAKPKENENVDGLLSGTTYNNTLHVYVINNLLVAQSNGQTELNLRNCGSYLSNRTYLSWFSKVDVSWLE